MKLTSQDIHHMEQLDKKHTCDGEDISPHLNWEDIPKGTRSFAISVINFQSKLGILSHWYVINIPSNITEIEGGARAPGIEIENDFETMYYEGPCPRGDAQEYHFIVHALNVEKLDDINKANFRKKVTAHTIESAEIVTIYERQIPDRIFL